MVSVSLLEKGYLINDIAEFYNIAECCNTTKPLVAQLAERGFAYNHQNDNENKALDGTRTHDLRYPPPFRKEPGITKPSLCRLSY
jgi:hypothetical protein